MKKLKTSKLARPKAKPHRWVSGWTDVVIYVNSHDAAIKTTKTRSTDSMICDELVAIHPGLTDEDSHKWNVTSLATGLIIVSVDDDAEAIKIAETLCDPTCKAGLEKSVAKEVFSALPPWVRPWLLECRKQGKWVDPTSFR